MRKKIKSVWVPIIGTVICLVSLLFMGKFCSVESVQAQSNDISLDPSKSLNTAFSRDHVKANELIRLENFWFNLIGDLTKRPGIATFNTATSGLDTFNVSSVIGGRLINKDFFLVVTGDSLQPDSLGQGRLALADFSGLDYDSTVMQYLPPDNLYDWTILKDTLIGVSGGAPTFVYTDSSGGKWLEIPPPGALMAVPMGDIGSGSVHGVFQYAFQVNQNNGGLSPPSLPIRLQGQNVFISGIQQFYQAIALQRRAVYRRDVASTDTTVNSWHRIRLFEASDSTLTEMIDSVVNASDSAAPNKVPFTGTLHSVYESNVGLDNNEDNRKGTGFPSGFHTVTATAGGLVQGTYAYGISYFNVAGDTTPIVAVGTIRQVNVALTNVYCEKWPIVAIQSKADSMIFWRTDVGANTSVWSDADTVFYVLFKDVATFNEVFIDSIENATLVAGDTYSGGNMYGQALDDGGIPLDVTVRDIYFTPQGHQVEEHNRQLWIAPYTDKSSVEFSEVNILDSFPISNKLSFPSTDGDSVTAIKSVGGVMVTWLTRSIWNVTGVDRFDVQKVKATSPIGCIASQSVAVWQNLAFFLSHDGVYTYSPGGSPKPISLQISTIFDSLSLTERERAEGFFSDNGKYFLSFDGLTLVYDTKVSSWTRLSFGASSYSYSQLSGVREIWLGSRSGDSVYVFARGDTTFTDTGAAFIATFRLPYIGPDRNQWQIREIDIDRGGSGNGLVLRFYDETNTLLDTMVLSGKNGFQKVSPSPKVFGHALSIELTDNKANDSLTIRSIKLIPRSIGKATLE